MDCKPSNVTVSLTRCDDISFNKKINSKKSVENHKTIEVKRSLRLSRKRTFQDELVMNRSQSDKKKKIIKTRKCNKTKSKEPIPNKSCKKKSNNQVSVSLKLTKKNLTNSDPHKISDVKHSPSATVNNETTFPTKTTLKTKISTKCSSIKNMAETCYAYKYDISNSSEDSVEFVACSRKRGRPSINTKTNEANDKADKQKIKKPVIVKDKPYNIYESDTSEMLDSNKMLPESYNKSPEVEKKWDEDNLLEFVKQSSQSCSAESAADQSKIVLAATPEELSVSEVIAVDDPRTHLRTFERQIYLLSKRFNIALQTLRNIVIKEPLSVFREKFSKSTTPSMLTVSPIVSLIDKTVSREDGNHEKGNSNIKYKVEPIRNTGAYEKTNLKDCINELSNIMPSWSLSIIPNPSRYVINQISINTYGIPIVNKSIVLDRYFRASVYINQCLQFKYCKRYHTAIEIINLIKELNAIR